MSLKGKFHLQRPGNLMVLITKSKSGQEDVEFWDLEGAWGTKFFGIFKALESALILKADPSAGVTGSVQDLPLSTLALSVYSSVEAETRQTLRDQLKYFSKYFNEIHFTCCPECTQIWTHKLKHISQNNTYCSFVWCTLTLLKLFHFQKWISCPINKSQPVVQGIGSQLVAVILQKGANRI